MLSTGASSNNTNSNINDDTMFSQMKSKKSKKKHSSKFSTNHNKYLIENLENTPHKERQDAYGTTIKKGSKKHKVTFIDVVSLFHQDSSERHHMQEEMALVEIIDVCSYKAYNEQMSYKDENQYGDKTDAHCCDGKCWIT